MALAWEVSIMNIGVPGEIKNREHRVAMTPQGAAALCASGHRVLIERGAGHDSGYHDDEYRRAGAAIVPDAAAAWAADLVVKVKEPQPDEYAFLRPQQLLFTYLHLATAPKLVQALQQARVCAIGYETVQADDGSLPLLAPMSRIAGRVAMQLAMHYLQLDNDTGIAGRGILSGGLEGIESARVLILGAGNAGYQAARVAVALGCTVTLLDINARRVAQLQHDASLISAEVRLFEGTSLPELLDDCDVLIGAALVPGAHAPRLLSRQCLQRMNRRGVFVDIAIDQGGMCESSRPTTYVQPVYLEQEIIHCCLPNLPSCVARSSTQALTAATLPYIRILADYGWPQALEACPALRAGINIMDGHIVHEGVRTAVEQAELSSPDAAD